MSIEESKISWVAAQRSFFQNNKSIKKFFIDRRTLFQNKLKKFKNLRLSEYRVSLTNFEILYNSLKCVNCLVDVLLVQLTTIPDLNTSDGIWQELESLG